MSNLFYYVVTFDYTDSVNDSFIQNLVVDYEADGVEEFSLEEYQVDEILGERAYSGGDVPLSVIDEVDQGQKNKVKLFFFSESAKRRAEKAKLHLLENLKDSETTLEELPYDDWDTEWRKFYQPIDVGNNLKIVPEWMRDQVDQMKTNVLIYPGRGFGTGNHETTFLCLQSFLQFHNESPSLNSILDFGCGSGILGIVALKELPNSNVTFVDIDPEALDNCLQNLELNFTNENLSGSSLVLRDRFKLEGQKYDLVFANILENVLLLEKEIITDGLDSGGVLIISGILENQVENIIKNYSEFEVIHILQKNDWRAIGFKKI